jgi:hypothetical protein
MNIKKLIFEQVDGFDFFDASDVFGDSGSESNPQEYEDFIGLNSGDKFTIGKSKPVFRVFGKPGSMVGSVTKNVVIDSTAGRKMFEVRLMDPKTGAVAAFEILQGGASQAKEPLGGKVAPIRIVSKG